MQNFDDFISTLKDNLIGLTREFGDDLKEELITDGKAFAKEARDDLEDWTEKAAAGELTEDELKWLIQGKKDLAEMEALKQKGLAKAKVDSYRTAMMETVVGTVFDFVA